MTDPVKMDACGRLDLLGNWSGIQKAGKNDIRSNHAGHDSQNK